MSKAQFRDVAVRMGQSEYTMNPFAFNRRPWTFGREIRNRDYLAADSNFAGLVAELQVGVEKAADVARFRLEPTNGRYGKGDVLLKRLTCRRAAWTVALDPVLLDKFFNGLMGIRAQYYVSPYQGAAMNAQLVSALQPTLLELARTHIDPRSMKIVDLSLAAVSAKTWICEKDLSGNKIIRASDLRLTEEQIQNDWLELARQVSAHAVPTGQYQLYSASLNGVRAPIADQLEVKGGWITGEDQVEYVTPGKHDRDCQVFMFGFT